MVSRSIVFACCVCEVFPVPEGVKVSPGVTEANVSWVVRGNLSGVELFCQVTADPVEPRRPTHLAEAADLQSISMVRKTIIDR